MIHDIASGPVRTCVGCGERDSRSRLLRVVSVRGHLTPDPRVRLPGRGAWLHPRPTCLQGALERGLSRAFRVETRRDDRARLEQAVADKAGRCSNDSEDRKKEQSE